MEIHWNSRCQCRRLIFYLTWLGVNLIIFGARFSRLHSICSAESQPLKLKEELQKEIKLEFYDVTTLICYIYD